MPLSNREKLGLLLRRGYVKAVQSIDDNLEEYDLTIRHYSILCQLYSSAKEPKVINQKVLSEFTTLPQNRLVDLLDDLESRSLVARLRDKDDRRAHILSLTDKGRKLFDQATVKIKKSHAELFSMFSAADREKFLDLLNRFVEQ